MVMKAKIAVMMMAPDSVSAPPKARGREPPFFLLFLDLLPRWEKGFPSGPWLPWRGRGDSPSEIGSISLFLHSRILPWHRFLYIWRSVTPIGLKFQHDFYPDISFLATKEGQQPPYGIQESPGRACLPRVRPYLLAPSGTVSC